MIRLSAPLGPDPSTRATSSIGARLPLWPTLLLASAAVLAVQLPGDHATAWHFFHDAARLLVGHGPTGDPGGLRLYGQHPEFQFGPLSVVAAIPFALLGTPLGSWVAMGATSVAGLVVFALLLDTARRLRPGLDVELSPLAVRIAGVVVVLTWSDVAVRTAHIDDAIALASIVGTLRFCAMGRGPAAVVALTVAAAAKPWAIMFAPLALIPPGSLRLARLGVIGATVALTWAPFVLAEPDTLEVTRFEIRNDPTTVLRTLGVDDPTTPAWVRPAQLIGGLAIVAATVATGRWPCALLAGIAWRVLLDPGAHRYYTIGVVLGAVLIELMRRPARLPWMALTAAVILEATALPGAPTGTSGLLRLVCLLAAVAILCGHRRHVARGAVVSEPGRPGDDPDWGTHARR